MGYFCFGDFEDQKSDVACHLWPNVSEKPKQTVTVQFLLFISYAVLQRDKINITKAIDACRFAMIVLDQDLWTEF